MQRGLGRSLMKILVSHIILCSTFLCIFVLQTACAGDSSRKVREVMGDDIQLLIPIMGLVSTLCYEDVKQTHFEGTEQWIKAFLAFEVMTESLKTITHKQRPNECGFRSFPSGHTAAAFMGSSFIHQRYGLRYAIPAYIGAIFVGYSRVQADKHYAEDVFSGAVIGLASGALFTKPYKGVNVMPMIGRDRVGLSLSKDW